MTLVKSSPQYAVEKDGKKIDFDFLCVEPDGKVYGANVENGRVCKVDGTVTRDLNRLVAHIR